ncbi:S8 family peptidase [Clostridium cellulovorans]|uniref:Peptidase S8 and S53 subtilisin kexin sedolisin n=1 Tax=Clostridium cellulovorans (strain ATCC 35296 / DSM 3052 / OCM 3 / 743B) TaxID=573061 RepID=D9SVR0_CLOC7|nr:S8 family serine peptidase [Clostridium cellulovorans]ADL53121.1 peptidase S8 and S53 subtilisin kexin sedolisin [Clostridium cellulovorans 743B]
MKKRLFSLFIAWLFLINLFGVVEVKTVLAELITGTQDTSVKDKPPINNNLATNVATTASSESSYPWYFNNLQVPELWKLSTGSGVTVAIIGSGIDSSHEDLVGKVIGGVDLTGTNSPYYDSCNFGTFAAGIITANINNIGTSGIAYDSKLLSVKVVKKDSILEESVLAKGVRWAADNGAKILNLTILCESMDYSILKEAIDYAVSKGCIIVAPSEYNVIKKTRLESYSNVITVGATNENNQLCYFSDYTGGIDLVAPGVHINSTIQDYDYYYEKYGELQGTSVAAAIVTGEIALIASKNPQITTKDILDKFKDSTFKLSKDLPDIAYGYGILDVKKILTGVAGELKTSGTNSLDDNTYIKAQNVTSPSIVNANLENSYDISWYKIYVPANTAVKLTAINVPDEIDGKVFLNDLHKPYAEFAFFDDTKYGISDSPRHLEYYMPNSSSDKYFYIQLSHYEKQSSCSIDIKYLPANDPSIQKDYTFKYAIDSPRKEQNITGTYLDISGWALSKDFISKVQAKIDDQIIDLDMKIKREDVYKAFSTYNDENSGFKKQLDIRNLSYGTHQLTLIVTDYRGIKSFSDTVSFNVSSNIKTNIDTIAHGMNILGNSLQVNGWALSNSTINKIEAVIDNGAPIELKYGQARLDVYNVYKEYNNKNSGFTGNVDIKKYGMGLHTMKLKVTYADGKTELSVPVTFNISSTIKNSLDTIRPNTVIKNGLLTVGGWVISKDLVDKVEVIIDNNEPVQIKYGYDRLDVYNVYKDYNNKKSGYIENLDVSKLGFGEHRLKIRITEKTGRISIVNDVPFIIENLDKFLYSIDTPSQGRNITGNTLNIGGWILNKAGVGKVEAIVDGISYGELKYGYSRPDVFNAYKNYDNKNSGFNGVIDISKLTYGKHEIQLRIIDKAGIVSNSKVTSFNFVEDRRCNLDLPAKGAKINGDVLYVAGWALSTTGITKVEALIDGVAEEIQYGLSRPDVYNAYKGYNNKNSGFSGKIDISWLAFGTHSIAMRYTDAKGKITVSETVNFNVENTLKYCIDTPLQNTIVNYFHIQGWALSKSNIKKVEALIDDISIDISYGYTRTDVYNVYKDYDNKKSGFWKIQDLRDFGDGYHVLKMRFTDAGGRVTYSEPIRFLLKVDLGLAVPKEPRG